MGESVDGGFSIDSFYGSAHVLPNGTITFDARDGSDKGGIFQLDVDFSGYKPVIDSERTILKKGDTLADGRVVDKVSAFDMNDSGSVAAVISSENVKDHVGSGVYASVNNSGMIPVVVGKDAFPNYSCFSSSSFGDIDIHDNDDILVSASYTPTDGRSTSGQGLFHLPSASLASCNLVNSTGEIIPGTDHLVTSFGLIDMHDDGNYVVQGSSEAISTKGRIPSADETCDSVLISSNVNKSRESRVVSATKAISAEISNVGSVNYGPRVDGKGNELSIVNHDDGSESLQLNGNTILETGDRLIGRTSILNFGPGAVGEDGVIYYTMITDEEECISLVAYNGHRHEVLLSRGDILSDGGLVENIIFGTTTGHVDSYGRLSFLCEFGDGSASLVVGIPA
jgi:hypothetical protein